jgi:hypothetical protein
MTMALPSYRCTGMITTQFERAQGFDVSNPFRLVWNASLAEIRSGISCYKRRLGL